MGGRMSGCGTKLWSPADQDAENKVRQSVRQTHKDGNPHAPAHIHTRTHPYTHIHTHTHRIGKSFVERNQLCCCLGKENIYSTPNFAYLRRLLDSFSLPQCRRMAQKDNSHHSLNAPPISAFYSENLFQTTSITISLTNFVYNYYYNYYY